VAVNTIDLAMRCNREGDAVGRNALLRKIRCPLLGALAMGMNAKSPTSQDPDALLKSLEHPDDVDSASGAVSASESEDQTEQVSLMVARLMTVQSLAESGRLAIGINWEARLARLRREMLSVLRAFLDASRDQQDPGGK
jgi:hypothetical protein